LVLRLQIVQNPVVSLIIINHLENL